MVIHPKFGGFIYLSAILIDIEVTTYDKPTNYNPCLECKLCSATCPTGAVASDGNFDFFSCVTHNYRKKLGGFSDWTENIAKSNASKNYRHKVSDSETVSMWQSLVTGGSTKCDQCMAVCPAGDEGFDATYHFTFTGSEHMRATVIIKEKEIEVMEGHRGKASLSVIADSKTWLDFLAKERNVVWAIMLRKIRVKGPLKLLISFEKCFPS